jgi:DMSO/TMAO reductase YedYZ molybdopterin-dependent catalytic subunit
MKPPSKSMFQPGQGVGQDFLDENRKLIAQIDRRNILRGSLTLGGLTLLGGRAASANEQLRLCTVSTVSENARLQTVLRAVSDWNDRVQAFIFRPDHLAPTYSETQVVKPPRFNAHFDVEDIMPVDGTSWKLELSGLIEDKRPWTVEQLYGLPEQELIIRHICVEGWDYIGQWSGVNLRAFFERIGADTTAKYVAFRCADDYTESLDMATALHPQTMLATKYAKEPIGDPFGFPLRLRTATKLGFKNAKWVTAIEVTNNFPDTFWRKQGFNWFAGL